MTLYQERRNRNKIKFYDASANRGGFQAVGNRIKELFDEIDEPITCAETDTVLRLKLKQAFNFMSNRPLEDTKGKQEQDASVQECRERQHGKTTWKI